MLFTGFKFQKIRTIAAGAVIILSLYGWLQPTINTTNMETTTLESVQDFRPLAEPLPVSSDEKATEPVKEASGLIKQPETSDEAENISNPQALVKESDIEARESLQKELDIAETGIHIVTIEMKKTNVPSSVQPSFNEVNQATQEKEQMIYQANEEYNKFIPSARGEADRMIREAEGYALNRVNRAKGDAARFREIYEE